MMIMTIIYIAQIPYMHLTISMHEIESFSSWACWFPSQKYEKASQIFRFSKVTLNYTLVSSILLYLKLRYKKGQDNSCEHWISSLFVIVIIIIIIIIIIAHLFVIMEDRTASL